VDVALHGFFVDYPTISSLAEHLQRDPVHGRRVERTAELLLSVSEMSESEAETRLGHE
jgi:hypothetical protein